ncbi:MAG: methionine--tRNA ligase [Candidatus Thalassarchaeaceae archaeon]|tara:strand:+ start:3825 stop:6083 length:2259 start_codon:yes stop_codon:yes gene_type:complete
MVGEHVLVCVAWPYANGPLHLGHVAGCYLPPDITARFERSRGNRVLMVSGSDEHGTPITVTAEIEGVSPQEIVDRFHAVNTQALIDLGCVWEPKIDPRGVEYGGALFNRTSDPSHIKRVQENVKSLYSAGLFEQRTMEQYYEVRENGTGRFLPDRYVEGNCPTCNAEGARGDQCDTCGATYEATELINPKSKMNPDAKIEIRPTEHLFYRLDLFQSLLEKHAEDRWPVWKNNVRAMTKQWLDMGLRPRAVTRDLEWGVPLPFDDDQFDGKCVYVWFEAVQGYLTCAQIWSEKIAISHPNGSESWKNWWCVDEEGNAPRHLYFLGKDNIPFHTVIWPALIMGLNMSMNGLNSPRLPEAGDLHLEDNVPAMEYLMLAGGQFSKSRKHAIWLPSFLEKFDPDTLRYVLTINMPEAHDTDFNWSDFVEKVNTELIAAYGNFVHRIMTLAARLPSENGLSPLIPFDDLSLNTEHSNKLQELHSSITDSLERHRYKEALRTAMSAAQYGNQMIQAAAPWSHLSPENDDLERKASLSTLAFGWRIARFLSIVTQPFIPFSAQRLWSMIGQSGEVTEAGWDSAIDWQVPMTWTGEDAQPLFERLDLEQILSREGNVANEHVEDEGPSTHSVKGSSRPKKDGGTVSNEPEGITFIEFDQFMAVDIKIGKIVSVDDHPDADRLYVVNIDDGSESGRTVCAGLKDYYSPDEMLGLHVAFVANLKPRKLRGVMSEGMMLAADDGEGGVCLLTVDSKINPGSEVR